MLDLGEGFFIKGKELDAQVGGNLRVRIDDGQYHAPTAVSK
ncbi:MAG: hypothetical protein ACOH2K_01225 [Burkholderiaceae bacterium]